MDQATDEAPLPKRQTGFVAAHLPPDLYAAVREAADEEGRSLASYLRWALLQNLQRDR
jgi:hypothetical protein